MSESTDIVVFGAGNIGRGLLGDLAARAGRRTVLVEADGALAGRLTAAGRYRVRLVGRDPSDGTVTDYTVLTPGEPQKIATALARCDFAATAVGGANLAALAGLLRDGIGKRARLLNILVCENWPRADKVLAGTLADLHVPPQRYACVPCSVERMVRRDRDSLDLVGESGESLLVDGAKWNGDRPDIGDMIFCDDLTPFYARKLYMNNAGHAVLAYAGALAGYRLLYRALENECIRRQLTRLLDAAGAMLVRHYGMDRGRLEAHVAQLLTHRFANKDLADTVARTARQPLRKLGPADRLVGLLRLLERNGLPTEPVSRTIGAALHYNDPNDAECGQMRQMIAAGGPGKVLTEICGMAPGEPCSNECVRFYSEVETGMKGKRQA